MRRSRLLNPPEHLQPAGLLRAASLAAVRTRGDAPAASRLGSEPGCLRIAKDENTSDPVRGPYIDNTDIFRVVYEAIN